MSRFLWNDASSQSKLALSNLGGIWAGNVRLYKAFFKRRIFTQTCCERQREQRDLREAECYYFLVSQHWVKSFSLFWVHWYLSHSIRSPDHRDISREEAGWCHDMAVMEADVGLLLVGGFGCSRSGLMGIFSPLMQRLYFISAENPPETQGRKDTIKLSQSDTVWFKAQNSTFPRMINVVFPHSFQI